MLIAMSCLAVPGVPTASGGVSRNLLCAAKASSPRKPPVWRAPLGRSRYRPEPLASRPERTLEKRPYPQAQERTVFPDGRSAPMPIPQPEMVQPPRSSATAPAHRATPRPRAHGARWRPPASSAPPPSPRPGRARPVSPGPLRQLASQTTWLGTPMRARRVPKGSAASAPNGQRVSLPAKLACPTEPPSMPLCSSSQPRVATIAAPRNDQASRSMRRGICPPVGPRADSTGGRSHTRAMSAPNWNRTAASATPRMRTSGISPTTMPYGPSVNVKLPSVLCVSTEVACHSTVYVPGRSDFRPIARCLPSPSTTCRSPRSTRILAASDVGTVLNRGSRASLKSRSTFAGQP